MIAVNQLLEKLGSAQRATPSSNAGASRAGKSLEALGDLLTNTGREVSTPPGTTLEFLDLLRAKTSDITATTRLYIEDIKVLLETNKDFYLKIKETLTQAGFEAGQMAELLKEIKDPTKDQAPDTEATAGASTKAPAAKNTNSNAAANADAKTPVTITENHTIVLNENLEDACHHTIKQLFGNLSEQLSKGSLTPETVAAIFSAPTAALPTQNISSAETLCTEIKQFQTLIKDDKDHKAIKDKYKALSPCARQALFQASKDFKQILNNDISEICAGQIKHNPNIRSAYNKAVTASAAQLQDRPAGTTEADVNKAQRQLVKGLDQAITAYKAELKNIDGLGHSNSAKELAIKSAQLKLQQAFTRVLEQGVCKDDIAWLQGQIKTARSPEEHAKDSNNFLNKMQKLLSGKAGITLTLIALPLIAKLIFYVPVIGPKLSGLTQSAFTFFGQISNMGINGFLGGGDSQRN